MKLNHLDVVVDWEGNPLMATEEKEMTYRDLVVACMNNVSPNENMGAEAKARSYHISGKMFGKAKTVELTVEERSFIKERAGVVLAPLTYGRICDWIENKTQTEEGE